MVLSSHAINNCGAGYPHSNIADSSRASEFFNTIGHNPPSPSAGSGSGVRLGEAELLLGDRKAFVNDRDHFVDLFIADHERWAELDRHKGAAQKTTLLHQLGDTATERMARRRRSPTEGFFGFLILDEFDRAHQSEPAHVAYCWMGTQLFEPVEKVLALTRTTLRQLLALQNLDVL